MIPTDSLPLPAPGGGPHVIVLEAPRGDARRDLLRAWTRAAGPAAWLLPCDTERGGLWAGVGDWVAALLPRLETEAPDLFTRHDGEIVHVLPALRTRVRPRHISLTDLSTRDEAVRNYAAGRARRIPHGVIDLLDVWHARTGGGRWAIACDDYDRAGVIARDFFQQLVRRRGGALDLVMVAAVEPGGGDAAADALAPHATVHRVRLALPAGPDEAMDPAEAARQAAEMEAWVRQDTLYVRVHAHDLVRLWTAAGNAERTAYWHAAALGVLAQTGFYEDALRHVPAVLAGLDLIDRDDALYARAALVNKVFTVYVTVGRMDDARDVLQREGLDRIHTPLERAHLLYQMAMLHARFHPVRDLAAGERLLQEALEVLEGAELGPQERHFNRGFLLNGLAYVRMRAGDAAQAAALTHENSERLDQHLPPERHRLHRSVLLYNAAQVYAQGGDHERALRHLGEAIEMDPHYSEYFNDRCNLLMRLGRLDEAERDYLQAVELSSPYPEVWFNLGQCHARMGRHADAERDFARAVDLDPARTEAWANLARTRVALGRREEALAAYDAALAQGPANPFVLSNRAALRLELGRSREALADLDRAVELAPDNAAVQRNRAAVLQRVRAAEPVLN